MERTRKIVLTVTDEQLDMLQGFYTASGWDFEPTFQPIEDESGASTSGE